MYRLGITNRTVKKLRIYRKITYHDKIVSKNDTTTDTNKRDSKNNIVDTG